MACAKCARMFAEYASHNKQHTDLFVLRALFAAHQEAGLAYEVARSMADAAEVRSRARLRLMNHLALHHKAGVNRAAP